METDADWGMVYDFMEAQCGELRDEHWEEVAQVYKEFNNDSRYWDYHEQIRTHRWNLSKSGIFDLQ